MCTVNTQSENYACSSPTCIESRRERSLYITFNDKGSKSYLPLHMFEENHSKTLIDKQLLIRSCFDCFVIFCDHFPKMGVFLSHDLNYDS